METEDIDKVYKGLYAEKAMPFRHFMLGYDGGLDPVTLQSAGIDFVDIKYKMLEKGTKVYTLNPGNAEPIRVYSLNLETLQTILAESSSNSEDSSDGMACVGVYELTTDYVFTMQIREDIAIELCMMWTKSKNKDEVQEETDAKDYRKLLQSRNPNFKNFLDLCFTKHYCPQNIQAVVYTRQSSTYGVLATARAVGDDFINNRTMVQEVVLPKSSISKLTVDREGYLRLGASTRGPTDVAVDSVYAEVKENEVFEDKLNAAEVVPSYDDNLPTAEEYNDYKPGDQSLDYEAIDIRPLPQAASPVSSPRPDQPPPAPPGAEPVYGIIDKSTKKPKGRSKSFDQPDTPGTPTGNKPPRPPPLDTMPNSDGESPAQSTPSHRPSRPSAPPRVQRSKTQDAGMGSSGNVSLDGKDDSVVAPPRSSVKAKGHQKSETSTRF
eukprot:XP_003726386.1 PREDICTED: uncharacterized protein LOC100890296 [Strongylocentrotus purpuratus]